MTDEPTKSTETNAARSYHRAAFVLLFALLVIRLVTAVRFGMAWDEAYYWQWSRRLALCYYDAGPGMALTIRAGTTLLGDTPLGVRFVPILMSVGANALMYATACRWFGPRVGFWTVALASIAPLLAIGSVLATYDLPQIFFWSAGLYAVTRAVRSPPGAPSEHPRGGAHWWYVTGLCVGLGTITKPTMIFFAPGVLLLLALVPAYRKHLASPHPYLAFVLAVLCLAPVFIWNAQNDNLNWTHTLNRGNRSTDAAPGRWLGEFWGGQGLVVGPFLLIAELIALYHVLRRPSDPRNAFIIAFTVPILAVCTLISLRSKVEINWSVAAHLTGLLAVAALWFGERSAVRSPPAPNPGGDGGEESESLRSTDERTSPGFPPPAPPGLGAGGLRIPRIVAIAVSALLTIVLFFPNALVIGPFGPFVANGTWEKVNEQYGWETIAAAVERERAVLKAESGDTPVLVAGTGYRVCSILSFYLPGQPFVEKIQIPDTRRDQYNLWTSESKLTGQNAVVAMEREKPDEEAYLRTRFASVSEPIIVHVARPGFKGPIKSWYVYRCMKFR
ncbi:MAG: glycosyltransferase family 39 protein [Akkermansiaceae bacterium]|nr:glycosyltransferase family 39 protein [Armatimonadota bacterium]